MFKTEQFYSCDVCGAKAGQREALLNWFMLIRATEQQPGYQRHERHACSVSCLAHLAGLSMQDFMTQPSKGRWRNLADWSRYREEREEANARHQ